MPDVGDILENDKGEKGVTAKFYKTAPGTKDRQQFAERFLPTTKLCLFDFKDPELAPGEVLFYADFEGYFTPCLLYTSRCV